MQSAIMQSEWITAAEASRRLDIDAATFKRIIRAKAVRIRKLPGRSRTLFDAADVAKLDSESVSSSIPHEVGHAASA